MTRPLDGRVAIVTGANHGIGAATVAELTRSGASVCATYLRPSPDPDQPDRYNRDRARVGAGALSIEADLRDPSTPGLLFDAAERDQGPVSILVHNASGWRKDGFADDTVTAETFAAQFEVDTRAGALLIAELARRHRRRADTWGRIVTLTSGGPDGFPGEASYGAAKAALDNYVMTAAAELADLGITANVVYPPVTDTGWVTDEVRRFVAASPAHHRVATAEEVAPVIAWLCTDAARLVSGSIIRLR